MRLTLGFAGAAAVLLTIAGLAIFVIVKSGLDGSLDANLDSRATFLAQRARGGDETGLRRALHHGGRHDHEATVIKWARDEADALGALEGELVVARRRQP